MMKGSVTSSTFALVPSLSQLKGITKNEQLATWEAIDRAQVAVK